MENIRIMRVHIKELNDCFSHEKGRCPRFKVITVLRKFNIGELIQT